MCSGQIPHPSIVEFPILYSMFHTMAVVLTGYWFIFRMRIIELAKSLVSNNNEKDSTNDVLE